MDDAKRLAEERRVRKDEASRAWERVLAEVAVPAFHLTASALAGEGLRFKVVTPGAAVRLTPERGAEEFVELALETERDNPAVMLRYTRGRGRRVVSDERVLCDGVGAIASLTEEDVIGALLRELTPFIER